MSRFRRIEGAADASFRRNRLVSPRPGERVTDAEWKASPWERALILQSQVVGSAAIAHPSWLDLPGVQFWGGGF